jgi:dTDP-glucose 4,6-dehydratase
MSNNVLITGGCGFIGSNFCVDKFKEFDNIVIVDSLNYAGNTNNISEIIENNNVSLIPKDIVNVNFEKLFVDYNINTIINFAAQTHVDNSYHSLNQFIKDNVITIGVILEEMRNHQDRFNKKIKLLHFSTDEIYGESSVEGEKFTEESPFNPTNPYSATKASAEMLVNSYKISFKMDIIIVRCNNVFGIKQYPEKVIPLFIQKALRGEALTIHGETGKIRDFIHTSDVNNAVISILNNGKSGEIYNIGIENPINILDLAKYIIDTVGKGSIIHVEDRPFNDYRYFIDHTKLSNLGWEPQANFYEKLDEIIDFETKNASIENKMKEFWGNSFIKNK